VSHFHLFCLFSTINSCCLTYSNWRRLPFPHNLLKMFRLPPPTTGQCPQFISWWFCRQTLFSSYGPSPFHPIGGRFFQPTPFVHSISFCFLPSVHANLLFSFLARRTLLKLSFSVSRFYKSHLLIPPLDRHPFPLLCYLPFAKRPLIDSPTLASFKVQCCLLQIVDRFLSMGLISPPNSFFVFVKDCRRLCWWLSPSLRSSFGFEVL